MKTQTIQFGSVVGFNSRTGRGRLTVDGEEGWYIFALSTRRVIGLGLAEPEFTKTLSSSGSWPEEGNHVAVLLEEDFDIINTSTCHESRRVVRVAAWNFLVSYEDAEAAIANRPVYEVVQFTYCNRKLVSVDPRKVIAVGTAAELQFKYPRGAKNDPLALESECVDFQYLRLFRLRDDTDEGNWRMDPRPLPLGVTAAKFVVPINSEGELLPTPPTAAALRELEELVNKAGGRRTGTKTPHPSTLVPA